MKKTSLFLIALCLCLYSGMAQVYKNSALLGSGQGKPRAVVVDPSQNIIVTAVTKSDISCDPNGSSGTIFSPVGTGYSAYISKYTPDMKLIWMRGITSKEAGTSSAAIDSYDVRTDEDGNIYVSLCFKGEVVSVPAGSSFVSESAGSALFIKYSSDGQLLWSKVIGNLSNGKWSSMVPGNDGSIILGFSFITSLKLDENTELIAPSTGYNGCLAKYAADGKLLWWKQIIPDGTKNTSIARLDLDIDDNVYVLGNMTASSPSLSTETGEAIALTKKQDLYLIKYNKEGVRQWIRFIGGQNNDELSTGMSLDVNKKGSIVLAAKTKSSEVLITDETNTELAKCETKNTGSSVASALGLRFDTNGTYINGVAWGDGTNNAEAFAATIGDDDVAYVGGYGTGVISFFHKDVNKTYVPRARGGWDGVLIRLDTQGNINFVRRFGNTGSEAIICLSYLPESNLLMTGIHAKSNPCYLGLNYTDPNSADVTAQLFPIEGVSTTSDNTIITTYDLPSFDVPSVIKVNSGENINLSCAPVNFFGRSGDDIFTWCNGEVPGLTVTERTDGGFDIAGKPENGSYRVELCAEVYEKTTDPHGYIGGRTVVFEVGMASGEMNKTDNEVSVWYAGGVIKTKGMMTPYCLKVINPLGCIVLERIVSTEEDIDVNNLPTGCYAIIVSNDEMHKSVLIKH